MTQNRETFVNKEISRLDKSITAGAINPENLKQLLAFLVQMLPIIFGFFKPAPQTMKFSVPVGDKDTLLNLLERCLTESDLSTEQLKLFFDKVIELKDLFQSFFSPQPVTR